MKTAELKGVALDWAVAKCEGVLFPRSIPSYSTNWVQGGPIIEREKISLIRCDDSLDYSKGYDKPVNRIPVWFAERGGCHASQTSYGPQGDNWGICISVDVDSGIYGGSALEAAMRCYVASKLGDEIEIPKELI